MIKQISELLTEVRDTLQDKQKSRWTDQELFRYLDQSIRDLATRSKYSRTEYIIEVREAFTSTEYKLPLHAIEFDDILSTQPYRIVDTETIEFPDNKDEDVLVEFYSFPKRIIFGVDTELDMDPDQYDSLRYLIVSKSYEKEDSIENIKKSEYFKQKYIEAIALNQSRWHGKFDVETSKQDFYK